ncbi:S53 family peptidase [Nostocoides sp. HKS02]|uniref:S53 family peptidase n=1 Tax=Nostocoides sp. HKS02 TaxID=1813880 RepID=UPI0012B4C7AD|nr:S53 family peptidase [Tetrasphaera sp. HKS02]QGN58555.1 hypothetical protein GKE56_12410 [Tetrasphaera sp. HKS02]
MNHTMYRAFGLVGGLALATTGGLALATTGGLATAVAPSSTASGSAIHPTVAEYQQLTTSTTPPTEAQCASVGRRCFTPQSTRAAYHVQPLLDSGKDGRGITIAIVDAYGSDTMANDLHVYNQAFGLPPMCGEAGVTCAPGMPTFSELHLQGSPATKAPPPTSHGTGQEAKSAWAIEVALDVETAHSMAPGANILLVTTPTAETLGVQGFPQMMAAEQYVVDHGLAQVISQSFASAEDAFGSPQSLQQLRHAFISASQHGVTVLGSSGDFGSANVKKSPVGGPNPQPTIPFPTVEWPASDPLVTGVGGTYLCTDPLATTGRVVDSTSPPAKCRAFPGVAEVGWTFSGGGFSHVFAKPSYQNTLPLGSTPIGSMRGVPDVALQASSGTGALIYLSLPPAGLRRVELWLCALQHRLVRHRRNVAVVPAVGWARGHRRPAQRRRSRPDQPGPVQDRREPHPVCRGLPRRDHGQQHHELDGFRLPGRPRLGPGDGTRHAGRHGVAP